MQDTSLQQLNQRLQQKSKKETFGERLLEFFLRLPEFGQVSISICKLMFQQTEDGFQRTSTNIGSNSAVLMICSGLRMKRQEFLFHIP